MEKSIVDPMAQLDANEAALARRLGVDEAPYIPPAEKFYHSNYMLDGCVAADMRTAFGYFRSAQKQLLSFRSTQRPDGMVPGVSHPPASWTWNPERWLSTAPFEGNDYTQTPDWARTSLVLYEAASNRRPVSPEQAIDPDVFLRDIYPYLKKYYQYFINHRQVAVGDPRAFLAHPHEANRDSGPEYDEWKRREMERQLGRLAASILHRRPRNGEGMPSRINHYNVAVDYLGALTINLAGYKAGWEPDRIRESTGEFVDVWFNCILYENYEAISQLAARLGYDEDSAFFGELAVKLEAAMARHYDPNARKGQGAFYSTYNGQLQRKDTIGNLASLLLPNLPAAQLRSNLVLMQEAFDTPFVLPCIATDDVDNWDPHYQEVNRHWHNGAVWGVANDIAKRGLDKQVDRGDTIPEDLRNASWEWFHRIHSSGLKMVEVTGGYAEHHDPIIGLGQRMKKTRGHTFDVVVHRPL